MASPVFLDAQKLAQLITFADLFNPLEKAMISVSRGAASHPPRFAAPVNEKGRIGVMYGSLGTPAVHGAKILSLFPEAPAMGLSSHQGFVSLFDSETGSPLVICDADRITAMRTAAMSMVATRALARPDPKVITVCGAGEQAEWHVRTSLHCFSGANIRIWARRVEKARALSERFSGQSGRINVITDLSEAIRGADVIHTTTASRTPFLSGDLLEAGQHINLVGASLADSREIDDAAVARLNAFTDSCESASREAGEFIGARQAGVIDESYRITEIGAVLDGKAEGRRNDAEITAYKSHGLIVQDLVAAYAAYKRNSS
ncbi:ornithine cyclodeaminase family protein [Neptunicoccus cionae]|uniref:ornithine cyclodeaminase family protein n=1 Tax=Neptunicoccus cionae TaxID=2035344 RepID=UPI000C760421|nr:ornithine cyclodeaminase family protein [Amylibacter cionae]PLS21422.1 ornithine cyclodeaminase [Amylibacter cionae]